MACSKSFTIAEKVSGETPLHTAVYVASTDTILGSSMNYVLEFDAGSGSYLRGVKTLSPLIGSMHLGLIGGAPYVAGHYDPSAHNPYPPGNTVRCDIFPVDTNTLEAGSPLGINSHYFGYQTRSEQGPHQFFGIGNYAYFIYPSYSTMYLGYINIFNSADFNSITMNNYGWVEQHCTDGTYIYGFKTPYPPQMRCWDTSLSLIDFSPTTSGMTNYWPLACEWAANVGKVHAVCGDQWMIRVDNFATSTNTYIDLEGLLPGVTGIKPMRMRYRSSNGRLYIPVQNKDGIIVYDPVSVSADWKTGFESPVDIVFTPVKAFAVQSSVQGLKEIV